MFENTSFEREADRLSIEPLKAGFDTALPRSFREMQKQIQLMKDAEAGKPVKFGSTNDAPPTLLVGGHLKKVANAARAGAAKADALARQRAAAIQAYAEAKKKRRLEERSS